MKDHHAEWRKHETARTNALIAELRRTATRLELYRDDVKAGRLDWWGNPSKTRAAAKRASLDASAALADWRMNR